MTRPLFTLAAVLVAVGSARAADDQKLPGPNIDWPHVKGLEQKKPYLYEDVRLGYSINYSGGGVLVTVYVYNHGLDKIPTGPDSDAVKVQMYESLLALEKRKGGEKPRYKTLSPLDEKVIDFGTNKTAPQIRCKRYEAELIGEGPVITELYLTGYKNHFLKIRATYPTENKEKNQKTLSNLLDAISKELK